MKINDLKQRLRKERPMTTVTLRMPEDVIEDLKRLAPLVGFSGYQPLIRAYIGQGMRVDLERLEGNPEIAALLERLRGLGVKDEVLNQAFQETFYERPTSATRLQYVREPREYQSQIDQARTGRVLAEQEPEYKTDSPSSNCE